MTSMIADETEDTPITTIVISVLVLFVGMILGRCVFLCIISCKEKKKADKKKVQTIFVEEARHPTPSEFIEEFTDLSAKNPTTPLGDQHRSMGTDC